MQRTSNKTKIAKSVVYLGANDWRIDFESIIFVMKALPDYILFFLSDPLFAYDYENQSQSSKNRNSMAAKQFEVIKKLPNFSWTLTQRHEDIRTIFNDSQWELFHISKAPCCINKFNL